MQDSGGGQCRTVRVGNAGQWGWAMQGSEGGQCRAVRVGNAEQ